MLGFERAVAGRYLQSRRHAPGRGRRLFLIGAIMVALTACCGIGLLVMQARLQARYSGLLYAAVPVARLVFYGLCALSTIVVFFLCLLWRLTIFTAIATLGLFMGTGPLVIVLSVMSGFEQDLKRKILGNHAHMVVTAPDRAFDDYPAALQRLASVPGVVAATPYLSSEVMLASSSNLSGVIIKGIDPDTIGRVTDLAKNTDVGSLDNLRHPEKLLKLGQGRGALGELGGEGKPDAAAPEGRPAPRDKAAPAKDATAGPTVAPAPADPDAKAARDKRLEAYDEFAAPPPPPRRERRMLPGVIVGRELAKNLRVFLGDDVNVVSPLGDVGPTGPIPKARAFRVAALFFSGMYEYDSKYIYMLLGQAQRFLGVGDTVTGIELKLTDPDHSEVAMAAVQAALGPGPDGRGYQVADWKQLNRSLFTALKLEKIAMFIALCFIILVATFSIVSNGIMLVLEKGREVAILKSMGASDGAVMRVFVLLGVFIGTLGTGVGIACGVTACWLLERYGLPMNTDVYYINKLPVNLNPAEVVAVLAASLVLVLAATLYPAWKAARLRPVEALR